MSFSKKILISIFSVVALLGLSACSDDYVHYRQNQRYSVYFATDSADLTKASKHEIYNASSDIGHTIRKKNDFSDHRQFKRFYVRGFTDTVGDRDYNSALAQRRIDSVKAELVRLGVDAGQIDTKVLGEDKQRKSTGDNVDEPKNRRVDIRVVL